MTDPADRIIGIDIDDHTDGAVRLTALEDRYGPLPGAWVTEELER